MENNTQTFTLNDGTKIPAVGYGTWKSTGDVVYKSVLEALKVGYRHIDTAWLYGNEEEIGRAIKDSGIPRKDIFLTTKLWCTFHRFPEKCLESSLERLQTDYVDLYLMHWPVPLNPNGDTMAVPRRADGTRDLDDEWDYVKTWELMQKLPKDKARAIGVSNCSSAVLDRILKAETTTQVPVINQVELHPYLPQQNLLDYCNSKGIMMTAYCPLGSDGSTLLKDPVVVQIAEKLNAQPAQVLISWALARGYVVLPKSVNEARIAANLKTIQLPEEDVKQISEISKTQQKRLLTPDWGVPHTTLYSDDY